MVERVRHLLLDRREPADSPLGYRFSKATDAFARATLDKVLDVDASHPRASYLLAELHATQGRLEEAERVIGFPQRLDAKPRYRSYDRALLRIMRGQHAEAVADLGTLTDKPFSGPDQYFMFQQAWAQIRSVALRHPEVDPLPLVREGLMTRVDEGSLPDEIERRGASETPLLVIVTSEDPYCGYCVDTGRDIEPFVRADEGRYDFIYTSVEPRQNIAYQSWAHVIRDAVSVPRGILFTRSRHMASTGVPAREERVARYDEVYPKLGTYDPPRRDYLKREARAELIVEHRRWLDAKMPVSAFASVSTDVAYGWGTSDGLDATQEQADERAMEICIEGAACEGIDEPCVLYVTKGE